MRKLLVLFLVVTAMLAIPVDAQACGSHGRCGGFYGGYYGRPWLVGGGAVAFRRSRRLARRSRRAAFFGFYGRSARLAWRANAAYNRGAFRAGFWY